MREGNLTAARRVLSSAPGLPRWESPWLDLERLSRKPDASWSARPRRPRRGPAGSARHLAQGAGAGAGLRARRSGRRRPRQLYGGQGCTPGRGKRTAGEIIVCTEPSVWRTRPGQKREAMAAARNGQIPAGRQGRQLGMGTRGDTGGDGGQRRRRRGRVHGARATAVEPEHVLDSLSEAGSRLGPLRADPRYAALLERFDENRPLTALWRPSAELDHEGRRRLVFVPVQLVLTVPRPASRSP